MFNKSQCVKINFNNGFLSRLNAMSQVWAVGALVRVHCGRAQARQRVKHVIQTSVGCVGLGMLSGCSVDMSRFAGAVGGATAEFTCAIVQLLFACEL